MWPQQLTWLPGRQSTSLYVTPWRASRREASFRGVREKLVARGVAVEESRAPAALLAALPLAGAGTRSAAARSAVRSAAL